MKTRRRLVLAGLLLLALVTLFVASCSKKATSGEYYCPMHPTYVSDRPGVCPICNMNLVRRETQSAPPPAHEGTHVPAPPETTGTDSMGMQRRSSADIPDRAPVVLDAEARRLAGVQTAVAVREPLARSVRTVGVVMPDETRQHHLHVKIGGFVEKLYLNSTGQRVQAGDPAFTFYSPDLLSSQEEFLRAKRAVAALPRDATEDTRRAAEDLVAAARRRLELYDVPRSVIAGIERSGQAQRSVTILAPASGFVTMKNVVEGQQVEPGAELFAITDLSRLWIEADFYENEAHLVRAGQTATLTLPYDPGRRLTGRVAYVYPYFDAKSRTLQVRFEVANPDLVLKPSMFVDVALEVEAPEGVVVPESAVLDSGVRQLVFVETAENRFEPRAVQVGLRSAGRILLLTGVEAGERVVVGANFLLDSESRLRGALGDAHGAHTGSQP